MSNELQKVINRTIEYGRKYGVEYGPDKIRERLISDKSYPDREIDKELKKRKMTKSGLEILEKRKVNRAKIIAKLIARYFPSILLVGITGSVAAGYPKENDDIDLMIITRKDHLWITRLWLRIFVSLLKIPHRRCGDRERKDELCFNFWLDEEALSLTKDRRNLENAMDLILMKVLVNKEMVYERFVSSNSWANMYVATGYSRLIAQFRLPITGTGAKTSNRDAILNRVVFWPQYWYMRSKIGNGLIDLRRAYFHPNCRRC